MLSVTTAHSYYQKVKGGIIRELHQSLRENYGTTGHHVELRRFFSRWRRRRPRSVVPHACSFFHLLAFVSYILLPASAASPTVASR